uniref:Uncharacterized protein n=1 Tax=Anopheles albimanus TaxID=7167 RepID=A0A182F8S5_ANOAL
MRLTIFSSPVLIWDPTAPTVRRPSQTDIRTRSRARPTAVIMLSSISELFSHHGMSDFSDFDTSVANVAGLDMVTKFNDSKYWSSELVNIPFLDRSASGSLLDLDDSPPTYEEFYSTKFPAVTSYNSVAQPNQLAAPETRSQGDNNNNNNNHGSHLFQHTKQLRCPEPMVSSEEQLPTTANTGAPTSYATGALFGAFTENEELFPCQSGLILPTESIEDETFKDLESYAFLPSILQALDSGSYPLTAPSSVTATSIDESLKEQSQMTTLGLMGSGSNASSIASNEPKATVNPLEESRLPFVSGSPRQGAAGAAVPGEGDIVGVSTPSVTIQWGNAASQKQPLLYRPDMGDSNNNIPSVSSNAAFLTTLHPPQHLPSSIKQQQQILGSGMGVNVSLHAASVTTTPNATPLCTSNGGSIFLDL